MSRSLLALSLLCLALAAQTANSAITSFNDKGLDFVINDNDPLAPTITFSDRKFDLSGLSAQETLNETIVQSRLVRQPFPAPPVLVEETKDLTFSVSAGNFSVPEITVFGTTSAFEIDNSRFNNSFDFGRFDPFSFDPIPFTIDWSIMGSTETVSGQSELSISQMRIRVEPRSLDASGFPDSVDLESELLIDTWIPQRLITSTVDGSDVLFRVEPRLLFGSESGVSLRLILDGVAVPVPPAIWMFGTGLLSLLGARRRKQLATN